MLFFVKILALSSQPKHLEERHCETPLSSQSQSVSASSKKMPLSAFSDLLWDEIVRAAALWLIGCRSWTVCDEWGLQEKAHWAINRRLNAHSAGILLKLNASALKLSFHGQFTLSWLTATESQFQWQQVKASFSLAGALSILPALMLVQWTGESNNGNHLS